MTTNEHTKRAFAQLDLGKWTSEDPDQLARRFTELFGWAPPAEMVPWLTRALPENDSLFLDSFEMRKALLGSDEVDDATLLAFFQDYNANWFPFTGLVEAGRDSSGDRVFFYLGHDARDFVDILYFDHEASQLSHYASSLCTLAVEMEADRLETEDEEDEDEDEENDEDSEDRSTKVEALRALAKSLADEASGDLSLSAATDWHRRATWLIAALAGEDCYQFGKQIGMSPVFSVWEQEKKDIDEEPRLYFYLLLAHFFLGNHKACTEVIEVGRRARGRLRRVFAEGIAACLADETQGFGRVSGERLQALRVLAQQHASTIRFEPGHPLLAAQKDSGLDEVTPKAYHAAIEAGDVETMKALLAAGVALDADYDHASPLEVACAKGQRAVVEFLLGQGYDLVGDEDDEEDRRPGARALSTAVSKSQWDIAERLAKANVNLAPAFAEAIQSGRYARIAWVLDHGLPPEREDEDAWITEVGPLVSGDALGLLLDHGVDVNGRDTYGRNALYTLMKAGNLGLLELVHRAGIDLDATDKQGRTALIHAAGDWNGRYRIGRSVEWLLAKGADKTIQDDDRGWTALQWARDYTSHHCAWLLTDGEAEKAEAYEQMFVEDPEFRHGFDDLHLAIRFGNRAKFDELMAAGANIEQPSGESRYRPLFLAAAEDRLDYLEALLDAGAEIEGLSGEGDYELTALAAACRVGSLPIARLLLEKGANVNAVPATGEGNSPLLLAIFSSSPDKVALIELLLEVGADPNYLRQGKHATSPVEAARKRGVPAVQALFS